MGNKPMITNKDMEDKNDAYDVALKILSLGNTESTPGNIADIINKPFARFENRSGITTDVDS